jgi:hypothetical protein
MTDSERNELLQEARIYAIAAPTILALLEKRKRIALESLQSDFRQGKTDNLARVAEITCLGDLEREIKQKEAIYNTMEMKK